MDNTTKLAQCFVEALGVSVDKVSDGLAYNSIIEWDSVGHMVLVTEIENQFDVILDTDDIIAMSSFAQARNILAQKGVSFDAFAK